jgi:hypothetical protein
MLQPLVAAVLADEAKNKAALQLAWLKYTMSYEEYAYIGLEMREREEKVKLDKKKQEAIDLYFWARVQIERRNDPTFPLWEGLRVVREG